MQEAERISVLFQQLYDGSPWLDITIHDTLKDVTAAVAARPVIPGTNSIWQIVVHLISWRRVVVRRIQGEITSTPESNYFDAIQDTSDKAWAETLQELQKSQEEWIQALREFPEENFEKIYPPRQINYYEHIHGVLQHDAYHLGQIVLLKKITTLLP